MAKTTRSPIPKTQREISISQQTPLETGGIGFQPTGNPNTSGDLNRGKQLSFKGDTTKPFSIGIEDIDSSIFYYFKNIKTHNVCLFQFQNYFCSNMTTQNMTIQPETRRSLGCRG